MRHVSVHECMGNLDKGEEDTRLRSSEELSYILINAVVNST